MLNFLKLFVVLSLLVATSFAVSAKKSPRKQVISYLIAQGVANPLIAHYVLDAQTTATKIPVATTIKRLAGMTTYDTNNIQKW